MASAPGSGAASGESDRFTTAAVTLQARTQLKSLKHRMLQRLDQARRLDRTARESCERWRAARAAAASGSYLHPTRAEEATVRELEQMVLSVLMEQNLVLPVLAASLHNVVSCGRGLAEAWFAVACAVPALLCLLPCRFLL